jgi:hypothetical protein
LGKYSLVQMVKIKLNKIIYLLILDNDLYLLKEILSALLKMLNNEEILTKTNNDFMSVLLTTLRTIFEKYSKEVSLIMVKLINK